MMPARGSLACAVQILVGTILFALCLFLSPNTYISLNSHSTKRASGGGRWCGGNRASNDDAGLHGIAHTGRASTREVLE